MAKLERIVASNGVESSLAGAGRGPRSLYVASMQDDERRVTLAVAVPAEEPQAVRMRPSPAISATMPLK
jgi:hypothetical protein